MNSYFILPVLILFACLNPLSKPNSSNGSTPPSSRPFSPGFSIANGIEPACSCEAKKGNRCWYIDANADTTGANGSASKPYNNFTKVVGFLGTGTVAHRGFMNTGDVLYVKGTFTWTKNVNGVNNQNIYWYPSTAGDTSNPTVIKTWPGNMRAIFDGEYHMNNMVYVYQDTAVKIQNIEVVHDSGRGIFIDYGVTKVDINNVYIHDNMGDGNIGEGGGVCVFMASHQKFNFSIHNSVFCRNYQNKIGTDNNISGLVIYSDSVNGDGGAPLAGSVVNVYDNIIHDEVRGIRHKHAGNIAMNAYGNLIYNCISGFYLRAYYANNIHNNILMNDTTAFDCDAEGAEGPFLANIFNNTIVNDHYCLNTGINSSVYTRTIKFYNNIFYSPNSITAFVFGTAASEYFPMSGWTSRYNCYYVNNDASFEIHPVSVRDDFIKAATYMSDTKSKIFNPGFVDINKFNVSLSSTSACRGFDATQSPHVDIGALPFGSSFTIDTNVYR
jgi:hypothetical protein